MDAAQIRGLKPKLRKYLQQYGECFCRCDTRGHLNTYVTGQLSTLVRLRQRHGSRGTTAA